MKYTDEQLKQILCIFGDDGLCESLQWDAYDGEIVFNINCNDFFGWAVADSEIIKPEDIVLLRQTKEDCLLLDRDGDCYFHMVFCCRKRKMRPQRAVYMHYPAYIQELFNEAGPERDLDPFNPIKGKNNA